MKKDYFLPASILIAALVIAGAIVYRVGSQSAPTGQQENLDFTGADPLALTNEDVVLGNMDAPVTIIEYSDFQCPFCGLFFVKIVSSLKEDYIATGKAKFVYRHFAFLGSESSAAAEASECAKDQGKFWRFHDFLFNNEIKDNRENNGNLNRSLFMSIASDLDLDQNTFASCLDGKKYAQKVKNDLLSGQKAGARATPTTFVNGQKIEGVLPYSDFKNIIEQALAK